MSDPVERIEKIPHAQVQNDRENVVCRIFRYAVKDTKECDERHDPSTVPSVGEPVKVKQILYGMVADLYPLK